MKLSIGIVGLPNVGKSTLFNALLKKQVADAANYPFCTIEPNVGIVEVPDERLPVLAKIVKTEKIVPAAIEFYDIAGIVKGASEGEGLGNKFLSHIREVSAIVHVVRLFEDGNVIHVANKVDPKSDIETIDAELILADLETVEKIKNQKLKVKNESEKLKIQLAERIANSMNKGTAARNLSFTDEERLIVKQFNLLTMKPLIYAFNVSESQLEKKEETIKQIESVKTSLNQLKSVSNLNQTESPISIKPGGSDFNYILFNAKLENEVLSLSTLEQKEYLNQYGLDDTGLNRLIKKSYETLGLISFLTAGTIETKAWTIQKGTYAPQAAGTIHTDFEKKFIKADIIKYQDFISCEGWVKAREQGKVTSAGKDYIMQDGDIVEFKIGS